MKKFFFSFIMLCLTIITGIAQVNTIHVGTTGSFSDYGSAGTAVNKQFNISTGTNVSIELTITGDDGYNVVPYHGTFVFYNCDANFSSLVKISECYDYTLSSITVTSTSTNGKMVVIFTYDGTQGDYAFYATYRPSAASTVNNFNTSGPVVMEAYSANAPNLSINDYTNKTMGAVNSTTSDYAKSLMLLKSRNYQLGLTSDKISASGNLGLTAAGSLFQTASGSSTQKASGFYFSTTNVSNALEINDNYYSGIRMNRPVFNKIEHFSFATASGHGCIYFGNAGAGDLWFRASNTPGGINAYRNLMVIKNNGNVGIGTDNPTNKLEVSGTIKATKLIGEGTTQWVTNGANINYQSGNVGIGTDNPTNKLEVSGTIKATKLIGEGTTQWVTNSANINYLTGNVGIGTSNFTAPLVVQSNGEASAIRIIGRADDYGYLEFLKSDGASVSSAIYSKTDMLTLTDATRGEVLNLKGGNVLIGKTTQTNSANKLEVEGNAALNGNFSAAGTANFGGDLILDGTNNWILHTPNDTRTCLYIAPKGGENWDWTKQTRFDNNGDVQFSGSIGINVAPGPNYKLNVWGNIRAHEVIINTDGSDFVFEDNYKLRSLQEVENFIKQHKHLPEIAPASEMKENGASLGEMQTQLLQKVEELTLYIIEQNKKIENMEKLILELQKK